MIALRISIIACLLGMVAPGCTVDTRSGDYRCQNSNDCPQGRTCEMGWCVVTGQSTADGASNSPCDPACSECKQDGTCVIDCDGLGTCDGAVACPAGVPCEVRCTGNGSCAGGVDCQDASACTVLCEGTISCDSPLVCGAGPCTVECTGTGSCGGSIDCENACACDTSCGGIGACAGGVTCPRNDMCMSEDQCSSTVSASCNRC